MIDYYNAILSAERRGENDSSVGGHHDRRASPGGEIQAARNDSCPVDRAETVEERGGHRQCVFEIDWRKCRIAAHWAGRGEIERGERGGRGPACSALRRVAACSFKRLPARENAVASAKGFARKPCRTRRSLGFKLGKLLLADGKLLSIARKLGLGRIGCRSKLAALGQFGGERGAAPFDDRHGRIEQSANPDDFVDRALIGERQQRRLAPHGRKARQ